MNIHKAHFSLSVFFKCKNGEKVSGFRTAVKLATSLSIASLAVCHPTPAAVRKPALPTHVVLTSIYLCGYTYTNMSASMN